MTQDDLAAPCPEFHTPSVGILAIRNLGTRMFDLLLASFLIAVVLVVVYRPLLLTNCSDARVRALACP